MNKPSLWSGRKRSPDDRQQTVIDHISPLGTLGTLDSLTRSFNDKHHPRHKSDGDKKSLLFYQLHEFIAAAPEPLRPQVGQLAAQLAELEAIQNKYRHQHAAGTHAPEGDAAAAHRSGQLAHAIHSSCVLLRGKAEDLITARNLGGAKYSDDKKDALGNFPCLTALAERARQIALLQILGGDLHDLHMMTSQVNYTVKPKTHERSALADYERETTEKAIGLYYKRGGDLAGLDLDLHKRLIAQREKPSRRNTETLSTALLELSRSSALGNRESSFHTNLQERLIRDYKLDRREIRGNQRDGSLVGPDPLQQRSAVLDVVYMARWRELASKLGDNAYDTKSALGNCGIKGDPNSHVVREIVKKSAVKVPSHQHQVI